MTVLAHLRRAAAVVAVVLVGLFVVILDPSAPSAMAYQAPPAPVSYPGTVLSTGNLSSPDLYNKALTANPGGYTTTTGAAAGSKAGLSVGGAAGTVVTGLMVGTSIGTEIASVVGLPTSGSFICDVGTLFGSACGVGAATSYVANSDVAGVAPGWLAGDSVVSARVEQPGRADRLADVNFGTTTTPAWSQPGSVVIRGRFTGDSTAQANYSFRVYRVATSGPPVSYGTGGGGYGPVQNQTVVLPTGILFDHLEVSVGADASLGLPIQTISLYPLGRALYSEISGDPQRWWRTTWQCSVGAGGVLLSAAFRESTPEWPGFPVASCDAGSVTRVLIEQVTEGLTTTQTLYDWTADPAYVEWAQSDCVGGGCTLLLRRIDSVTGSRLSCFDNPSLCVSWFSDPDKLDNYECTYGGNVVDLSECNVYSPTFNPAQTGRGINYADPETGVAPEAGTGTEPGGEPQDNSCPPPFSWSALVNPWYYYKGTVCALQDAFVPQNSTAQMTRVRTAIDQSSPGQWSGAISGMFDGLSVTEGSCTGPRLRWEYVGLDVYPFNACNPPMSGVASWSRILSTAAIGIFGAMACLRALGSGFGWKPSAGGDAS
ncbi:hypothetical protein [Cellulomonas hominis]